MTSRHPNWKGCSSGQKYNVLWGSRNIHITYSLTLLFAEDKVHTAAPLNMKDCRPNTRNPTFGQMTANADSLTPHDKEPKHLLSWACSSMCQSSHQILYCQQAAAWGQLGCLSIDNRYTQPSAETL